jgi:tellurite resistance protein TerC
MGMNIQNLKRALKSEGFRKVRKIVVAVAGTAVILVGIVLLFLPGPAFVVIPAGFGILAIEFDWARSWMRKIRAWLRYLSSPKT